ncbi:protein ripply3 [Artibeus jamaicensis]|uniref:protein ripply3 n=1 Tax=Artibeus jamaicensis TaxID=9417 RepID=UPI00235A932E|nr:protein ripply3 [Artibeus jamaicensis]
MRPETAAGAREARGRVCHCPAEGAQRSPPPREPERPTPWRPWLLTPRDAERTRTGSQPEPGSDQQTSGSKGAFGFRHPVRLYLPISKREEFLQSSGERVLASFPVQATIHFYDDTSDSEDAEHEEDPRLPPGGAQGSPGAPARDQPVHRGGRSGGRGGSPGGAECSSSK